jgi:hypothetical protein
VNREVKKVWPSNHHPARMLTLPNGERVAIDALILPAVRKLNHLGLRTDFSCQGDQRKTDHQWRDGGHFVLGGYLSLAKGSFPQSLIEAATRAGFYIEPRYLSVVREAVGPDLKLRDNKLRANNRRFIRLLQRWADGKLH